MRDPEPNQTRRCGKVAVLFVPKRCRPCTVPSRASRSPRARCARSPRSRSGEAARGRPAQAGPAAPHPADRFSSRSRQSAAPAADWPRSLQKPISQQCQLKCDRAQQRINQARGFAKRERLRLSEDPSRSGLDASHDRGKELTREMCAMDHEVGRRCEESRWSYPPAQPAPESKPTPSRTSRRWVVGHAPALGAPPLREA
jgi:hypothetical protein